MREAFLCALITACSLPAQDPATDLVNPFVGTGGHGHTFPGACVPNGLVQLSPDTRPDGYNDWDGCGGYHYGDSLIYGFSHTHLSGTGVADLCDVLLMPMHGTFSTEPGVYRSRFSHADEQAHAGYYRVLLGSGIGVELTATPRCGMHRYSMPAGSDAFIVLDLRHRDKLLRSSITAGGDAEITGERRSGSWAVDQRLFFCIRASRPCTLLAGSSDSSKAVLSVGSSDEPLILKVGISAVSVEGARKNLDAEVPGWDFDAVRKQAEAAWNEKLGRIQVSGGTPEQQRIFYTALYHCYVAPCIFNDVDGSYRGMDGLVHQADHDVYTVFSLWDTFRALHPLMTILEPELTGDFIKTFLLHYKQGGKLPVWELWGNETNCMIGYHSVSVIADAYMKGIRGFDADLALEAMVSSAMADDPCLNAYRDRGYISSEDCAESVSKTLEYAYDDWCIAQMARSLGHDSLADAFTRRSRNWQNLFDPGTKFFRPRRNGGFIVPFDPYEVNFHYTEANAWQYGLFAPHDVEKLIRYLGGPDSLAGRLDDLFTATSRTTGREQADITGLIGQYAHGNEPSHHMAALYHAIPAHASAERRTHQILVGQYHDAPDGLAGNEDCGQLSAWYVMNAMGLYQICPGRPVYSITAPLFDQVEINTNGGPFVIHAPHDAPGSFHLEAVRAADGTPTDTPEDLLHEDLVSGGRLDLVVGREPDRWPVPVPDRFARSPDRPANEPVPAAIISAPSSTFHDSLVYQVTCLPGWSPMAVELKGVGDHPDRGTIRAFCLDPDGRKGPMVVAVFNRRDPALKMTLESAYANQYAAGGDQALIDGLRGGRDLHMGEWQGFQGRDVLATVDLGSVKVLKRAGLSMLQDQRSWIWYPAYVDIATSMNGRQWSGIQLDHAIDRRTDGTLIMELWTEALNQQARYIKIMARNAGPCPDWHPSKGGASWIFLDEILIETE